MVNIAITQNGEVIGDSGKVIAYTGQKLSEPIQIVHPIFEGNPIGYFVEYKYNQTIFKDKLNSNNIVQLKIERNGYITCQFIVENLFTGSVVFKSKPWNFIVKDEFKVEPSHYPCSNQYYNGHECYNNRTNHCNDNTFDSYKAYYELKTEIENEESIRFNEILKIQQDIIKIKAALNISDNNISTYIDANKTLVNGIYNADITSVNFPELNQQYRLIVNNYTDHVLQQAFEIDSDNVWYRTGTPDSANTEYTFTKWAPLIMRVETL